MAKNGLFNKRSYAYKEGQSTINILLDMCKTWSKNIDSNYQSVNIFFDMSAVFDCVSHSTLVAKMKMYKFGTTTTKLITSYLSHRYQYVKVNGQASEIIWIKQGVPQ